MSYRHERTGLVKTAVLTWERETSGLPATTYIPPTTDIQIDYEPLPDSGYDPTPGPTLGTGFGKVYILANSVLYRTDDFSASSPAWTDVGPSSTTLNDFILDPWNPATTGFILSDDGVYRSQDLDNASPSWSLVLTNAEIQTMVSAPTTVGSFYKIIGSINTEDWFGFACTYPRSGGGSVNGGFVFIYSTDGGDNWTDVTISSVTFRDYNHRGALDIVPHLVSGAKVLYASAISTGTPGSAIFFLYKSTNNGTSWSQVDAQIPSGSPNGAILCHCPYEDNEDGQHVYWGQDQANSVNVLFHTTNSGTTTISPDPTTSTNIMKRWAAETYTLDRLSMYCWVAGGLYTSDDGGANWSTVSYSGLPAGVVPLATGGFPNNVSQFYLLCVDGSNAVRVFVSTDRGSAWTEKTGDLSETVGSADKTRSVIVPLWTE